MINLTASTKRFYDGLRRAKAAVESMTATCKKRLQVGPPRYFVPVCVRTPIGFVGGPSGYIEVPEAERDRGPIIVEMDEMEAQASA